MAREVSHDVEHGKLERITEERCEVRRHIMAPPEKVVALLADPDGLVRIHRSEMARVG